MLQKVISHIFNSNQVPIMKLVTEREAIPSTYRGIVIKHKGKWTLGIIKINVENINVDYIPPDIPIDERPSINSKEQLRKMYPECFENGPQNAFPNYEYHITTDPNVKPVIHSPRRIPLGLRDDVKKELDRMVARGAITKVNEPTKWVNSIVTGRRADGRVRICLDPLDLNKAIQREHYAPPVL